MATLAPGKNRLARRHACFSSKVKWMGFILLTIGGVLWRQHKQRLQWFPVPRLVIATQHQVLDATISPNGKWLALAYFDAFHQQTLELRDKNSGAVRQTFLMKGPASSIDISRNGRY
jgi:hypothetical protein